MGWPAQEHSSPNTPHTMSSAGGLAGAQHIPFGGNKPRSALLLSGAVGAGDQGVEPVSGPKLLAGAWEQERRLRGIWPGGQGGEEEQEHPALRMSTMAN